MPEVLFTLGAIDDFCRELTNIQEVASKNISNIESFRFDVSHAISAMISRINANINGMSADISIINTRISQLNSRAASLRSQLSTERSRSGEDYNAAAVAALSAELSSIQQEIAKLSKDRDEISKMRDDEYKKIDICRSCDDKINYGCSALLSDCRGLKADMDAMHSKARVARTYGEKALRDLSVDGYVYNVDTLMEINSIDGLMHEANNMRSEQNNFIDSKIKSRDGLNNYTRSIQDEVSKAMDLSLNDVHSHMNDILEKFNTLIYALEDAYQDLKDYYYCI